MAVPQPVIVCQEKVRTEQVLIEKAIDTMTEMLQELEQHRVEKPSGTSVAGETLEDDNHDPGEGHGEFVEHIEPVRLQERLVLRSNVPISKEAIRALHEKYREAEAFINKVLVEHTETGKKLKKLNGKEAEGFSEEDYILLRGALRETHQAELKAQAQIDGVVTPEIRGLELLEQFYRKQGAPNKAEALLLSQITRHSPIYIQGWFAAREKSLRTYTAMFRKMVTRTNPNAAHDIAVLNAMYMMEQDEKKPLWSH
ncbi:MAG: hypothetical protein L6R35_006621 [Caloplaca aegaea]|nr:MAG: hypothetical protein L6R35_006621 [Caloplaca aegaea]